MSDEPEDTLAAPEKNIRAVLPREFTREDLAKQTKRQRKAALKEGEIITWTAAKERAIGYFKAMCGAPPYDKTVLIAPAAKKKKEKRFKKESWWAVTLRTNKERQKIMKARMEILKKIGQNQSPEPDGTSEEETSGT